MEYKDGRIYIWYNTTARVKPHLYSSRYLPLVLLHEENEGNRMLIVSGQNFENNRNRTSILSYVAT